MLFLWEIKVLKVHINDMKTCQVQEYQQRRKKLIPLDHKFFQIFSLLWYNSTYLAHHQSTSFSNHTASNTKHESEAENIKNRGIFVLWTRELMNQFLRNHQLNKAEIGKTDKSILDLMSESYFWVMLEERDFWQDL